MKPVDDPLAEVPDDLLEHPGWFRRWMRRSTPVNTLLAAGFVLLIVSVVLSQTFGYFDRQAERDDARAERHQVRSELTCRSRFTNDVTQAEGSVLVEIGKVVDGAVTQDDAAVGAANVRLRLAYPALAEALARRNVAEKVCAGRPAS